MHRYLPWMMLAAFVWYAVLPQLLAHEAFAPLQPSLLGLAFNSMAEHLLAGRFDIDPDAIGAEAFITGGRTLSYFGIFCALPRIPLIWLGGAALDVTRISCWIALCISAWCQARAVMTMRDSLPATPRRDWLSGALILTVLAGGAGVQFARPSVYQEAVDWALALAMGFVLLAVRGLRGGFRGPGLSGMAVCAGLALLARVSFGLGLYAALGGLLLVQGRRWSRLLIPVMTLTVFALAAGVVNQARWGDPLVFADFHLYALNQDVYPDRLVRLDAYGAFNPARLWLGISYYLAPVWAIVRGDGRLLFAEAQTRLLDVMELPWGSFLLSDPLLLLLCGIGVATARPWPNRVLLAGLAVPPLLMLCAISMTYRYRAEFLPLFMLGAVLALPRLSGPSPPSHRWRHGLMLLVAAGVIGSHIQAHFYAQADWGPAEQYLTQAPH